MCWNFLFKYFAGNRIKYVCVSFNYVACIWVLWIFWINGGRVKNTPQNQKQTLIYSLHCLYCFSSMSIFQKNFKLELCVMLLLFFKPKVGSLCFNTVKPVKSLFLKPHLSVKYMFWNLFIFRGHLTREPASIVCNDEQDSAGPHRNRC